jgi:hypothetical protein
MRLLLSEQPLHIEFTEKKAELNGLSLATPTKSNRSPSNN